MTQAGQGESQRSRRTVFVACAVLVFAVVLISLRWVGPAAPDELQLLAGPAGSHYARLGERYAVYLRGRGLAAHVIETEGALDNLTRLASDGTAAAGFAMSLVEHELPDEAQRAELASLGSLEFSPFWIFVRSDRHAEDVGDLVGWRVGRGLAGGGTRAVLDLLLEGSRLEGQVITSPYDDLGSEARADALIARELDAACFTGLPSGSVIARLIASDSVRPLSARRAEAYANRYAGIAHVAVPEGALDLRREVPEAVLQLLVPATVVVTRRDLHPAVVDLLLDAARHVHRELGPAWGGGRFPSADHGSLPLSPAARRYFDEGPSRLRRVLPFRVATLIDRFAVVVLPAFTVAFGLLKLLPSMLQLPFRIRRMRSYRQLMALEKLAAEGEAPAAVLRRLDEVDRESAGISVPPPCRTSYLELRQYLHDMRERLREPGRAEARDAPERAGGVRREPPTGRA